MTCTKVRYRNEVSAKIALFKLQQKESETHKEQRAYPCPLCKGWHLTSQEKNS